MGYSRPFSVGVVDDTVVRLLNEALEGIPDEDSAMRARLVSRLGREQYFGDLEESQGLTSEAVEMARRVGDKRALVETLWNMGWGGTMALEGPEERVAQVNEAIQLAEELGDRSAVLSGTFSLIATQMILGDSESAFANIDAYAGIAEEVTDTVVALAAGVVARHACDVPGHDGRGRRLGAERARPRPAR